MQLKNVVKYLKLEVQRTTLTFLIYLRKSELEDIDSGILGAKEQIDNDDIGYDEGFTEVVNCLKLIDSDLMKHKS